ncbi:glycosyl hydrolase [Mycoplasmatota bacterium WC30]
MKKILFGVLLGFSFLLASCSTETSPTTQTTADTSTLETTTNTTSAQTNNTTSEVTTLTTTEITTITTTNIATTEDTTFTTTEITTNTTTIPVEDGIDLVEGIEDIDIIVGHYFNTMNGIQIMTDFGKDISSMVNIEGYVDYGTIGSYELTYDLVYNNDSISETRTINVIDGDYVPSTVSRPTGLDGKIGYIDGSYFTGTNFYIDHPVDPIFIENSLLTTAVPSSGWWTSLLVANYGGSNGIYTNPLRTAFSNEGLEITNPEDGFVQYWNVGGVQTMAQFPIAIKDTFLKSSDLNLGYTTEVIDYTDSLVKVAMRNNGSNKDEMVVTMVQGSPYVFAETANKNALSLTMEQGAAVEFYSLNGTMITGGSHIGNSIIVKYVQRHVGYNTSLPANVGSPQYGDKYYIINAPDNSAFSISNNVINMTLGDGNFISIAAINDMSEAEFYHNHGYTMITNTSITYDIDYKDSLVYTDYIATTQQLKSDVSTNPLQALMPHHYKYSEAVTTDYSYRTVRGTLKVMEGKYFQTVLSFNGLLPGFTLPENADFSSLTTVSYLHDLDSRTEINDPDNFYNEPGPYWNGKALYPLAQGIIVADQLGEEELKNTFIGKLRYLLADWYTYTDAADEKYLYYNNDWGTVYYSNNDFNTATELSDHSFTHGYLVYASSVLAMYDPSFVEDYGMIVDLLLDDYMFTEKSNSEFAYLRNFDSWAGHSWAHGFGTFAEGNNLESTSEALNSWNAGYLWALATNDQDRMEAAIYGFATEISAVKEYWFDYDEENWDPAFGDYVDVAGMVWGGKHDYATWFGANPTFIYGIQWLPTGEYLTNYAMNDEEYTKFSSIYATYLAAKDGEVDRWFSNMWAIQAIIDPSIALSEFNDTLILNDEYPSELVGTYWMINALETIGRRTSNVWMELQIGVSSTIYEAEDGSVYAMVWNVSDQDKTINFYNADGLLTTSIVEEHSFTKILIN